jgi:hypothetical protein
VLSILTELDIVETELGGYFLIRVANLDSAIAIASRIPGLRR